MSRARSRARLGNLFEAADRPTLTGAAGAHAHIRRLRGNVEAPCLSKGMGQRREQVERAGSASRSVMSSMCSKIGNSAR